MATITVPGMFLTGTHAARPAANAVGKGTLYSCSDHNLIYQSDGSSWSTWADATGSGSAATIEGTRLRASGTLTHNNSGGFFELLWDTEDVDDGGWHSLVSATGRITVASAGWVDIVARVEFAANATGTRAIRILRNGTEIDRVGDNSANVLQTWECVTHYKASASDYFQVEAFQNSGGNLNLNVNALSRFTVKQVR